MVFIEEVTFADGELPDKWVVSWEGDGDIISYVALPLQARTFWS